MRGGSCAASGTSAAEHPYSLVVRRRGSGGVPQIKDFAKRIRRPHGGKGECESFSQNRFAGKTGKVNKM